MVQIHKQAHKKFRLLSISHFGFLNAGGAGLQTGCLSC